MGFKRKSSRVDVGRSGRLQRGALTAPCTVLDVSESGVRLESRLYTKIGDALQLTMELATGKPIVCELEVVYVRSPKLGAKIVSMSPKDREQLTHALEEHVQHNFSRH
ncbi:MAG TPA: PilZ domain-containing protein [Nitrospira sp.]|nr:PilZ domain-containing protein [Nitrospira sp.]